MQSVRFEQVQVGTELPGLDIPLTTSLIVSTALASRDFTPVHHDKGAAQRSGVDDVFMNILTTNGLVGRFVTDWAGPDARVTRVAIRLGTPNLPGDTMKLRGTVKSVDPATSTVEVDVKGANSWGNHVTGTVVVELPKGKGCMPTTLKDEAAIAGIGETEYSKNSKRSELQLGCEALRAAIADCGVDPKEIDGMSSFTMDSTDEIELARALGIGELRFISKAHHGGGAATATLHQAAMAVATGAANYVVCYRTLNGRSGHRFSMGVSGDLITSDTIHYSWYMPSGLLTPASWVAMFQRRYAHKFGTTAEQLGHVAISIRDFAVTNPRAFFYQRPLTMEDYLASKWIVEPFRLYDCCQESDGAACCIVTTPERARDLRQKPALIRGVAQGSGQDQEAMTSFYREDIGAIPEMDVVAREVWNVSGLSPDDVDAAIIYDAFTAIVLWQLESFGFCKPGEAQELAASGGIARGGRLPTNTNGGQLSEAYIHGMNGVNEGVRLVRGESVNQPDKDVNHVLVTSGVGVPTSAMILGRMD